MVQLFYVALSSVQTGNMLVVRMGMSLAEARVFGARMRKLSPSYAVWMYEQ